MTLYTYTIIPYSYNIISGSSPVAGTAVSISAYASPFISQNSADTYVSAVGTTTLTLNYKNGAFGYVLINRNGTELSGMKARGSTPSYIDTGLVANTQYTYVITPYNPLDSAGLPVTLNTMTLP
jgi:hypothetical protein